MKQLLRLFILGIFSTACLAQTWQWQNPWLTNRPLTGIQFSDDSIGWVVGYHGTICRTANGGSTWTHQAVPVWSNLYDCAFANSQTGWAVGEWGTILHTTNGGEVWTRQDAGFADCHVTAVTCTDEQNAWACGQHSQLLRTTDGGEHWRVSSIEIDIMVYDMVALTGTRLLAAASAVYAGHQGYILSTTDGGETWTSYRTDSVLSCSDIAFSDSLHGWVWGFADDGIGGEVTLTTTDGGATWQRWSAPEIPWITHPKFLDSLHGWANASERSLAATEDGGHTWTIRCSDVGIDISDHWFTSPLRGWAIAASGDARWTDDGGATWHRIERGCGYYLHRVVPRSPAEAWVAGAGGSLLHTIDSGFVWSAVPSGTTERLYDLVFANADTAVAVGSHGVVLRSTDGGIRWTSSNAGTSAYLKSVCFPTRQRGFAAGSGGVILRTDDGGLTWAVQSPDTVANESLWDIAFVNADVGWAVGGGELPGIPWDNFSTILRTTDGGRHWSPQSTPSHAILYGLWANDEREAWAVGAGTMGGVILHTTDGGQTWPVEVEDFWNEFFSLAWVNDSAGWICGKDGVMMHTTNRGQTWDSLDIGTTCDLSSIAFVDEALGWVVGDLGTIIRYHGPYSPPPHHDDPVPSSYTLSASPNPFNPSTIISFDVPTSSHITLSIYDLTGRTVQTLTDQVYPAGTHRIFWDAFALPSGLYFARLKVAGTAKTQKLVLLK